MTERKGERMIKRQRENNRERERRENDREGMIKRQRENNRERERE
uniref:Uncharacterized protein n=1 Tax=Octopus bimaculoides TaxID=37653 RepID=A0A0L8HH03_OCTBM